MNIQIQDKLSNRNIVEVKSERIEKGWGYEEVLINNEYFCSKILHYNKRGSESSAHLHIFKREYFRCVHGSFKLKYKDSKGYWLETVMSVNDAIYIPPGCPHKLISLEDNSEILEISTTHDDTDVIRIEPGDSQKA